MYGVPALLVEVLSPSNAVQDTEIKRDTYARAGVPEYWIVDPRQREVVIYSAAQDDGTYAQQQRFGADEELISPTLPIRTQIDQLFAGAPDTTL